MSLRNETGSRATKVERTEILSMNRMVKLGDEERYVDEREPVEGRKTR